MRLRQRRSVLLPQPDGPINAVTRLSGTFSVISLMARLEPYMTLTSDRRKTVSSVGVRMASLCRAKSGCSPVPMIVFSRLLARHRLTATFCKVRASR